jgi:hypothetical protein
VTAIVRPAPDLPWFTEELQDELIEAGRNGLKTEWVARYCGVAPHALKGILDLGARRDAVEPFRTFFRRWIRQRTELMKRTHDKWVEDNDGMAFTLLKELWPDVYGKDAKPDHDPFSRNVSNADELAQLEAIIENPWAYGDDIGELFRKHGRLRPDGT